MPIRLNSKDTVFIACCDVLQIPQNFLDLVPAEVTQKALSKKLMIHEIAYWEQAVAVTDEPTDRALARRATVMDVGASAFLTAPTSHEVGYAVRLNSIEFRVLIAKRLGAPLIREGTVCRCGHSIDLLGDHISLCMKRRTGLHHRFRDLLAMFAENALLNPRREPRVGLDRAQRADLVATTNFGIETYYDVVTIAPFRDQVQPPMRACDVARKEKSDALAAEGLGFVVPLAFDLLGGIEAQTRRELNALCSGFAKRHTDRSAAVTRFWVSLSLLASRWIAGEVLVYQML